MSKQIYLLLTPQQYQALLSSGRNPDNFAPGNGHDRDTNANMNRLKGRDGGHAKGIEESPRSGMGFSKGFDNSRAQALPDIVIKLLTTRSAEQVKP